MSTSRAAGVDRVVAVWAVVGTLAVLGQAVWRLSGRAWSLAGATLTPGQQVALVLVVLGMAWTEGWRGFHLRFSPRVVARALRLGEAPWWAKLLAPPVAMGLLWGTRRRLIASWALLAVIVTLIVAVRALPWPWREIVDAGVVVGLGLGMLSVVWHATWAALGHPPDVPAELPGDDVPR